MSSERPVAAQWIHFERPVKPADISADIPHFQLINALSINILELEARVGIERLWGRTTVILCLIPLGIQADCVTI
jgi:hypothetical protein